MRRPIGAQDDREPGWYDSAELSFVTTSGNSESDTFGFRNTLERLWNDASFSLLAGGLRVETTTIRRFATGTPASFTVVEDKTTELTAENYYLRGRYDRTVSERLFWFAGLGWERNQFAGFDSRVQAVGGIGNTWLSDDQMHFKTAYGLTYTQQDDLIDNPKIDDSFLGLKVSWDYRNQLTDSARFTNTLAVDQNLSESDDLRADMITALSVAMSERYSLKLSWQLLYDNLPALVGVALVDSAGVPTGTTVLAELDDLDSLTTIALVISF